MHPLRIASGLVLVVAAASLVVNHAPRLTTVMVGTARVRARVASSPAQQRRGLAGVRHLESSEGMWFVFDDAALRTFWMKNMQMPIDLVWVRDGVVVGTELEMVPDDGIRQYRSPGAVDHVLELAAGQVAALGISAGQRVESPQ